LSNFRAKLVLEKSTAKNDNYNYQKAKVLLRKLNKKKSDVSWNGTSLF